MVNKKPNLSLETNIRWGCKEMFNKTVSVYNPIKFKQKGRGPYQSLQSSGWLLPTSSKYFPELQSEHELFDEAP